MSAILDEVASICNKEWSCSGHRRSADTCRDHRSLCGLRMKWIRVFRSYSITRLTAETSPPTSIRALGFSLKVRRASAVPVHLSFCNHDSNGDTA